MPPPLLVTFAAGQSGTWRIDRIHAVCGEALPAAERLWVTEGQAVPQQGGISWQLCGTTSNPRYSTRAELNTMAARQEALHRPAATKAALIPIRKTDVWWAMAQDERRTILEERSRHIAIGLEYLPAVARRLHHSRELGQPFDFLTWFEFEPAHEDGFEELVRRLRHTEEWRYVDRELDIRLTRLEGDEFSTRSPASVMSAVSPLGPDRVRER